MTAFYAWTKGNGEDTKKHLSYGGETMCGVTIPTRHEYSIYSSGEVCIRCQKAYVKELKEMYGDDWKDYFDESKAQDLDI